MINRLDFTSAKASAQGSPLSAYLCFSVYTAMLRFNKIYRRALKVLKITYPQYLVLMVLRDRDNVSMTDIAQKVHLESSTLTPLLKRLEEQGIVCRRRYAFDERQVIISLTAHGNAIAAKAHAVPAYVTRVSGLAQEENLELRRLLGKLNHELERNA
jgi:DNA-binding MarR family transcriptional regulator